MPGKPPVLASRKKHARTDQQKPQNTHFAQQKRQL